jgi:hypothetical protein
VKGLKIFQTWLFFNEKILIFKFVTWQEKLVYIMGHGRNF